MESGLAGLDLCVSAARRAYPLPDGRHGGVEVMAEGRASSAGGASPGRALGAAGACDYSEHAVAARHDDNRRLPAHKSVAVSVRPHCTASVLGSAPPGALRPAPWKWWRQQCRRQIRDRRQRPSATGAAPFLQSSRREAVSCPSTKPTISAPNSRAARGIGGGKRVIHEHPELKP